MNRRDLLKYFGAGTIITPLVSSAPMARIIEPPKVELFQEVPKAFKMADVASVSVRFNMKDGTTHERSSKIITVAAGRIIPGDETEIRIDSGVLHSPFAHTGWLEAAI